jgi:hypothetical protein
MRYLLACAIASFSAPLLVGCATDSKPSDVPYTDQRSVTMPRGAKKADVLVRVCELQTPPGPMIPFEGSAPAGAKLVASTETLASFGTPFYFTVGLPEQRFELGGRVVAPAGPGDRTYRMDLGYANNGRIDHTSVSTNVMLPLGEPRVVMGCTNGRIITLVLEPAGSVAKSPATRP